MQLSVRPLADAEWPLARALLHRAFVEESWTIAIYGEPTPERWSGSWDLYSSLDAETYSVALGAFLGEVLVGVVMGSVSGACRHCQVLAHEPMPDDPHLAIEWQFQHNVAQVHARLGPHAWIEKVAVEPLLHGSGIGRRMLESSEAAFQADSPVELVLECAPNRLSFYTGLGFEVVSTVVDPAGPDAYVLHQWIGGSP